MPLKITGDHRRPAFQLTDGASPSAQQNPGTMHQVHRRPASQLKGEASLISQQNPGKMAEVVPYCMWKLRLQCQFSLPRFLKSFYVSSLQ